MISCDPDRTQTCNLLIRSQMLYSIKLRDLLRCKYITISLLLFKNSLIPGFVEYEMLPDVTNTIRQQM